MPVAAIYGANASGKSNIYNAFEYMSDYAADSFKYGDEDLDLSGFPKKYTETVLVKLLAYIDRNNKRK